VCSIAALQEVLPHAFPTGYAHAPLPSQSVAPHVPLVIQLAVDEQQCVPVPEGPQRPLLHPALLVQGAPGAPPELDDALVLEDDALVLDEVLELDEDGPELDDALVLDDDALVLDEVPVLDEPVAPPAPPTPPPPGPAELDDALALDALAPDDARVLDELVAPPTSASGRGSAA
jgi:hypothetical protein